MLTAEKALLLALVDLVLVALLVRWIPAQRFRGLGRTLALTAAGLWATFGTALILLFWDEYYRHFAPSWAPWAAPVIAVEYGLVALCLWWLARRLPVPPALGFCLLGGLESVPEHLLGIYVFRILDLPMLRGESAEAILWFAFFEYVLYWGIVLGLAAGVAALRSRWQQRGSAPTQISHH